MKSAVTLDNYKRFFAQLIITLSTLSHVSFTFAFFPRCAFIALLFWGRKYIVLEGGIRWEAGFSDYMWVWHESDECRAKKSVRNSINFYGSDVQRLESLSILTFHFDETLYFAHKFHLGLLHIAPGSFLKVLLMVICNGFSHKVKYLVKVKEIYSFMHLSIMLGKDFLFSKEAFWWVKGRIGIKSQ